MVKRVWLFSLFGVLILFGCTGTPDSGASEVEIGQLPTRIPTATPEYNNLDSAERTVRAFLSAWQNLDYASMYILLNAASQQATPFETFVAEYNRANAEMTLISLTTQVNGLARDTNNNRISVLNYDATFTTNILGEFSDTGRNLYLELDATLQDWRVAWSRGDIFREMEIGGQVRLEAAISRRANIYDRNGVVLANQNGRVVTLNVVPQEIPDVNICLDTLTQAMNLSRDLIQDRLSRFGSDWLGEVGTIEVVAYEQWRTQLEQNCNAQFDSRSTREYVNGTLAPHVLGTVGYLTEEEVPGVEQFGFNQDSILGRSGIEGSWDETLRGTPGGRLSIVTPDGRTLRVIAESTSSPALSVYLTLDAGLQQVALEAIQRSYDTYDNFGGGSRGASAVVMDVNTGAILAMVSYPTYDANILAPFPEIGTRAAAQLIQQIGEDPRRPLFNRVTQGLYPTGSIFKTITSIAILDTGIYAPETRFTCIGSWQRDNDIPGGRTDWLAGGHGTQTTAQGITNSCNPFFYEAGWQLHQLDENLLPEYAVRLGLGGNTGMTDVAESPGFIGNPETIFQNTGQAMSSIDTVSMAIGQGHVSATPLEMVRYYAAVANNGILLRPQLVDSTRLIDDVSYQMEPDIMGTFGVPQEVLDEIHSGMCAVTTASNGTAEFVFRNSELQALGVCGKTGTAEDQSPERRSPHAWFAAYAPRENPQIAIITMVENSGQGSEVAAPIARDILEYYFFGAVGTR
ncbi:MAG: penicillin-binding transpeptidase domain-containing protein [Aggregatilineales bacterium]